MAVVMTMLLFPGTVSSKFNSADPESVTAWESCSPLRVQFRFRTWLMLMRQTPGGQRKRFAVASGRLPNGRSQIQGDFARRTTAAAHSPQNVRKKRASAQAQAQSCQVTRKR